ncbi:unnamed protein product [Anisakis simplex]|uniref:VCBS repeat-containing protein n=1 Tax=Anisakis simplex TaxID=6269 RepID=A0A0M3KH42_ANISI|nr:unnamed protein product [Anisakis simplex]
MYNLLLVVCLSQVIVHVHCEENEQPTTKLQGQICAYGDIDRDLNTDLIVQDGNVLKVYLQAYEFNETFFDQLSIMDINGDGSSDLIGFLANGTFFCRLGSAANDFLPCEKSFRGFNAKPYEGFLHGFVDITGDLSAEVIFGTKDKNDRLKLQAWQRISNDDWKYVPSLIGDLPVESGKYYGAALFADFDADGLVDIGIPWCADASCTKIDGIKMWNGRIGTWQHLSVTGLEGSELVSNKGEGNVVFRVGDFSLDGYPDMIALVREKTQNPMILENVPCTDCISNVSRSVITFGFILIRIQPSLFTRS